MPRWGPQPRPSKYQPLADFLAAQEADTVTLALAAIETILGTPLPNSAYVDNVWWRYPDRAWVRALIAVGWQARLQIRERAVVFTRAARPKE